MIRVLIVDDSPVVQEFLAHILASDPELHVIGSAGNGDEAVQIVEHERPHVITMDIHMPKMSGVEAIRRIMETYPTPIVVVTGSSSGKEVETAFHAMEAGALAAIDRPKGIGHPDYERAASELVQTVKLMAEVKVVRRWPQARRKGKFQEVGITAEVEFSRGMKDTGLVAIGASTGGPAVLQTILSRLPKDFPVPVLIVQHMAAGFVQGFVDWLAQSCDLAIHIASHGEHLFPGHVYIAPDGFQMKVEKGGTISLTRDGPENGLCPSVSYLFRSVANVYGPGAIGVLLTGMGTDGVEELKALRERGAATIVQDKESSVVHGMPGEAIRLDAATYVLSPERIATALASLANRGEGKPKESGQSSKKQ